MRFSIRLKLIAFTWLITLLVSGGVTLYGIHHHVNEALHHAQEGARSLAAVLARTVINDLYYLDVASLTRRLEAALVEQELIYAAIADEHGEILAAAAQGKIAHDPGAVGPLPSDFLRAPGWISRTEGEVLQVAGPIQMTDGRRLGYVHVRFSLDEAYRGARKQARTALYVTGLALVIGALLSLGMATRLSRPISTIAEAARKIGEGTLETRLRIARRDELGLLAGAVNQMATNLSETTVSKAYVDNIIQSMADGLIVVNLSGTIQSVNRATLRHLECKEDELVRKPLVAILPGDGPFPTAPPGASREEGSITEFEHTFVARDGRKRVLVLSRSTMRDGRGEVQAILYLLQDVTERKRAEEALADQSALLQATLDNVTQGISAFDRDLRLVAWNQRYFELRDLPPALARRGTPFADILRCNAARGEYGPGDPEEQVAQRLALARTREPQSFERPRPNGTVIEVCRNPMPGGGFVTTYTDITERKQAEQMKTDFVSFVTHQLRTPLSGIKWLLELADQAPGLPEETHSYIADAQAAADRLVGLVNDLLDISQLERGKLSIVPRETRLEELTQGVVDELAPLIAEKGHRLSVTGAEHLPPIWVDPQLLRQVVLNLASNAIKYTPPGGEIAIRMGQEDAAVHWAIQDSGIGIPKAGQGRLFEKFYRADNVYAIETEGTGLGLYLVRLIVTQLGGRVWCDSEEGKGATFTFTLPVGERG